MADLAWSIDRDARDPARVAALVEATCSPLSAGRVRPLVAVRRAGKTWALRAIEYGARDTHRAVFIDLRDHEALPVLDKTTNLVLLDEPSGWLGDDVRAKTFFTWIDGLGAKRHVVLALTMAELATLRSHVAGRRICQQRSEVYLPTPDEREQQRVAGAVDRETVPWRWRSSFHLLRTWVEAAKATTAPTSIAPNAERLLLVGGASHGHALYQESLPEALQKALASVGRGDIIQTAHRDELIALGLVREVGPDGPWHIADPILAAQLTPLRIHHISDVHIGDKAAETVDAKDDPTTGGRMTAAVGQTFVRDEYVGQLRHLAAQGRAPHLVVISGDLVERAGDPPLVRTAQQWVDQIRTLVTGNDHPCLHADDPRVLLVGGNHDVDWGRAGDTDPQARHRAFAEAFPTFPHPHLEQPIATRTRGPILFRDARLAIWLLGSAELGGEQLDHIGLRTLFELADKHIVDTDGRVALEAHRPKPGKIDPGLVDQKALDVPPPPAAAVRIAVLHHPVTSLPGTAPEITSFAGLINAAPVKAALRNHGYQLVLHGHLHHGALVTETSHDHPTTRDLHIAAAPSLGSKEIQEQHGFNAITLTRALPVPGQLDTIAVRVERHTFDGKGSGWSHDGAVMSFVVRT